VKTRQPGEKTLADEPVAPRDFTVQEWVKKRLGERLADLKARGQQIPSQGVLEQEAGKWREEWEADREPAERAAAAGLPGGEKPLGGEPEPVREKPPMAKKPSAAVEPPQEPGVGERPMPKIPPGENKLVWAYKEVDPKELPEEYRAEVVPEVYEAETGRPFRATMHRGYGREDKGEVYSDLGSGEAIVGEGTYWAPYEHQAKKFGPKVESRTVELKNPLVIESDQQLKELVAGPLEREGSAIGAQAAKIRKVAEQREHDGLVINVPRFSDMGRSGESAKILREWFGDTQVVEFKKPAAKPEALDPEVRAAALADLKAADPMAAADLHEASMGVFEGSKTTVDTHFGGKGSKGAAAIYDAFAKTRELLRSKHGDTIKLFRWQGDRGLIPDKNTLNWVQSEDQLGHFEKMFKGEGRKLVEKEVPIDDIAAVYVGAKGKYEEFVVLNRESKGLELPASHPEAAAREPARAVELEVHQNEPVAEPAKPKPAKPEAKPEPEVDYGPPEVSARNEKGDTTDEFLGERLRPHAVVAQKAGAETDLTLADGTKVRVIPVMVELDAVQPSHKRQGADMRPNPEYPPELQTREYSKSKTAAKDVVRWGTSDWNEDLIYKPSPTNATGPPVVHPKFGATEGGTSRWNILNEREAQHPGSLQELAARHQEAWGFEPRTSEYFEKPAIVLVQLTGLPQSKAQARKLSDLMNVSTTRELTTAEKAVGMAAKMGDKTIEALDAAVESAPDKATLNQILERSPKIVDAMLAEGVIPDSRKDALYDQKTKRLTPQGRREVEDAIIARVIPRPDLTQRLGDDLRARISLLAPSIMRAQKEAPGFLDKLMADAIESEIHRAGMKDPPKIEDYLGPKELFPNDAGASPSLSDPRVAALHRILAPSQSGGATRTTAKKRLAAFSKRLEDSRRGQDDMFGEKIAGDPATAFEKTFMSGDMRQEARLEEKVVSDEGAREETRPGGISVGDQVEVDVGTYKKPRVVTAQVEKGSDADGYIRVIYPNVKGDKQLSKRVKISSGKVKAHTPQVSKMTTPKVSKTGGEEVEAEKPLGPGENYRAPEDMRVVEPDASVPKGMPRRIRRGTVLYKILKGYRWSMNFGRLRAKAADFGEKDRGFQQSPQG